MNLQGCASLVVGIFGCAGIITTCLGAVDGPDCPTFVAEVQEACRAHFRDGLNVSCTYWVSIATPPTLNRAEWADDPTFDPRAYEAHLNRQCAINGNALREAVASADRHPMPQACVDFGEALDDYCLSRLGTPEYDPQVCSVALGGSRRTDRNAGTLSAHCNLRMSDLPPL